MARISPEPSPAPKTTTNVPATKPAAPKPRTKKSRPLLVTAYLFAYNAISALAWLYPLVVVVLHLSGVSRSQIIRFAPPAVKEWASGGYGLPITFGYGPANDINPFPWAPKWLLPYVLRTQTTYSIIGQDVKWIQTVAALEIVHSLLGWVRSPLMTTVMQVFSRLVLVWGIADQHPSTHSNPLYTTMVLAWSLTEVIRYSFYACAVLGFEPYSLLWLRYTTFYALYPIGAGSEAFLMFSTLPITMNPPKYNFSAWTVGDYVRLALYAGWWPALYFLYTYMIAQRRKMLGGPRKVKKVE